jgi:dipicolinate synthase subunit A
MIYAAKRLSENYDCFVYGLNKNEANVPVLREISKFKNLVLPLPATRDGVNINAPHFMKPLPLALVPDAVRAGGTVYSGGTSCELREICERHNLRLVDYFEREELTVMNAMVTAESTLEILIRELGRTVFGAEIMLTGFGRISKILAKYLAALGARVTVAARKYSDLAWAEIGGCKTVLLSEIGGVLRQFDVVINTVPAIIFGADSTKKFKPGCLTVDLASKPGFADAEALGVIHALSLPGKSSPVTAGQIVADTIVNIINEAGGESDA